MPTLKLNLPTIDNTKTADVVRDMNALANAVDAVAGTAGGLATLDPSGKVPSTQLDISAPADASTTQKGVVMLEDSTTSTSVTKAATPNAVKVAKEGLATQIGTLANLNTSAKESIVDAVNEANGKIGTLSSLNTTLKSNVVTAINEVNTKSTSKVSDLEVLLWMGVI